MTTLDDLKKRATAAELTLIEATIAAIRPDVVTEVNATLMEWLKKNDPTDRIDHYSQEQLRRWYHDLKTHLSTLTP